MKDLQETAISAPPTGRYRSPGAPIRCCPGCGMVVEHFLTVERPSPAPSVVVATEIDDGEIFGEPLTLPAPPVLLRKPAAPEPVIAPKPFQVKPARELLAGGDGWAAFDDPLIGGKFSVLVSLEGREHRPMLRTIRSVLDSIPEDRRDLHITYWDVSEETMSVLERLPAALHKMEQPGRAKALAQILSPETKLEKYLVWFSDLAHAKTNDWALKLVDTILRQPPESAVGFYGVKRREVFKNNTLNWFRNASWFRGRPFRNKRGAPSPNGNEIHYTLGHFWAASVAALRGAGVPDARLETAGLNVCIGEQLYQAGWNTKMFDGDSRMIGISAPHAQNRTVAPWYKNG